MVAVLVATPATAQIVQSAHVGMGLFYPRGFDSRHSADVLVADQVADQTLDFKVGGLKGAQFFGEWTLQVGNHVEVGAGVGYYRGTAMTRYPANGFVGPDLQLRIVPITGIVRLLLFGSPWTVQPYLGAGIAALRWQYREAGRFQDNANRVSNGQATAAGMNAGPVYLFGVRLPVGDMDSLTVEWRYQYGLGKTGGLAAGFLGDRIDLGGGVFNVGYLTRF